MMNGLLAKLAPITAAMAERRALAALLAQDDRAIRDIGLTRADLEAGLAHPRCLAFRHAAWRGAPTGPLPAAC